MDYFAYRNGKLFAESVDVETIARAAGTPVYIYSKATFLDHLRKIQAAFSGLDTLDFRPDLDECVRTVEDVLAKS